MMWFKSLINLTRLNQVALKLITYLKGHKERPKRPVHQVIILACQLPTKKTLVLFHRTNLTLLVGNQPKKK